MKKLFLFLIAVVPCISAAQTTTPAVTPAATPMPSVFTRVFDDTQRARMDSVQIEQSKENAYDPSVVDFRERTRVLVIGAHPDDEDTPLITWLARGRGVETAYLSLTRGEGGQNQIGKELGEALGQIRTNELLAARRIDGGRQFLGRAYDFGFSKTAADAFNHWPRDSILDDIVRVIRRFRPHIIVSIFLGTPQDGHGQHQVTGILARAAYDSSGDATRFPEEKFGAPWTVLKFYRGSFFQPYNASIRIDIGEYNPEYQKTYADIAAESRAQHKSQGFEQIAELLKTEMWDYLRLEASRVTRAVREKSIFDGLPTTYGYIPLAMQKPVIDLEADIRGVVAAFPPPSARPKRATTAQIRAMPVKVPTGMQIGYIEGVGDNVAPVLSDMGFAITLIKPDELARIDLHKFTAIVVGTRAYAVHKGLVDHNKRLLNYLQWGGTLVVQYGQYELDQPGIMPYSITVARPNATVTIQDAPVKILKPKSPLLNRPNKITAKDWDGWVQDRSSYMPAKFDQHYEPIIEMNDPGEPPNSGGILVAKYGKGTYVYTTLSFFRQLPAGVPGAAKLFVNILYAGQL